MTARQEQHHEHIEALGRPPEGPDTTPEPDFANEHDRTAVDADVITDEGEREPESPHGWSGMQR
ncbi:hypothetical protein MCAG_01666 [Micromonospora sp. ATCC 39149]|uniref:Uncharacterized protein n=1 Tax=Micromonospora carbonacea TaxID=47853 RepID=A0A7D5YHA0_9ACTN|nr:hypothetical protein [Micromonospora sp. ATCC 39149]EEP71339.1 hypothetical protein MCAG_01666 [Micromonospora sp. ATCC 39149]QLJ97614.1 hypothetical protein HZU44_22955 [Micromonospora carbonacea]